MEPSIIQPEHQLKSNSGLSNSARRVVFAASVIAAFLLGVTIHIGDSNPGVSNSTTSLNSDIAKILGHEPVRESFSTDVDQSIIWTVRKLLSEKYLRTPLDEKKMFYGAIKGMTDSLEDPYTNFFDPEDAKAFADELNGEFEGIGAEIGIRNGYITIIAPLPDSPAEKAGLRAKDIIVKIEDTFTDGMTTDAAVRLIRGKGGTEVKLTVLSDKAKATREVKITRSQITFLSVRGKMLPQNLAYIEVFHFNDETADLFRKSVTELARQNPKGWIIDLRNNPGGLLTSAVDILGEFVPNQIVVQEKTKQGIEDQLTAYGDGRLKGKNVVLLVNGGSASASEIVSGALQDYAAATLIGEQTFGKGVVQELVDLPGGSEVKVTVAEWLTGKGRSIDKVGVTPDQKVELSSADVDAGRDPQLDAAKKFLLK
ncbi:MAG: S41 family peptidase [bacterium]